MGRHCYAGGLYAGLCYAFLVIIVIPLKIIISILMNKITSERGEEHLCTLFSIFRLLSKSQSHVKSPGASIPMGQGGGHVPPIFIKGDIHGNVPPPIF